MTELYRLLVFGSLLLVAVLGTPSVAPASEDILVQVRNAKGDPLEFAELRIVDPAGKSGEFVISGPTDATGDAVVINTGESDRRAIIIEGAWSTTRASSRLVPPRESYSGSIRVFLDGEPKSVTLKLHRSFGPGSLLPDFRASAGGVSRTIPVAEKPDAGVNKSGNQGPDDDKALSIELRSVEDSIIGEPVSRIPRDEFESFPFLKENGASVVVDVELRHANPSNNDVMLSAWATGILSDDGEPHGDPVRPEFSSIESSPDKPCSVASTTKTSASCELGAMQRGDKIRVFISWRVGDYDSGWRFALFVSGQVGGKSNEFETKLKVPFKVIDSPPDPYSED